MTPQERIGLYESVIAGTRAAAQQCGRHAAQPETVTYMDHLVAMIDDALEAAGLRVCGDRIVARNASGGKEA